MAGTDEYPGLPPLGEEGVEVAPVGGADEVPDIELSGPSGIDDSQRVVREAAPVAGVSYPAVKGESPLVAEAFSPDFIDRIEDRVARSLVPWLSTLREK